MKHHKHSSVINVAFYVFAAFKIDTLMLQLTARNHSIDTLRLLGLTIRTFLILENELANN